MDELGRNKLWERYIASHDSEVREQLIYEPVIDNDIQDIGIRMIEQ